MPPAADLQEARGASRVARRPVRRLGGRVPREDWVEWYAEAASRRDAAAAVWHAESRVHVLCAPFSDADQTPRVAESALPGWDDYTGSDACGVGGCV